MPTIVLKDATFARLQQFAEPLVDDADSLLTKLMDQVQAAVAKPPSAPRDGTVPTYPGAAPPDLTHTKPVAFSFNGVNLVRPNWNGLLVVAVRAAHSHAKDPGELRRLLIAPHVRGKKEDEGYTYLPDLDLSYQGQDANSAWKAVHHIAEQLDLPAEAEFVWRHKDGAAFPGQPGRLVAGPMPTAA